MQYEYGPGPDQINDFFRAKRSWSKVKDKVFGDYINTYLKTVQHLRRRIVIVDGFAGPGIFGDDTDGSPSILCKQVHENAKGYVGIGCLFADAHPGHRAALERNLAGYIADGTCERPFADWSEALTRALKIGTGGATLFFYLDPYGIKELDFDMVRQIYERDPSRSTEVLINFNFRTFMRMSGSWNYADTADEVSKKVKQGKTDTVNRVMGGDYWLQIITDPRLSKIGREDAVVGAYLERLRQFFKFAYAIPVKERLEEERGIPDDELAHYHLIFGTRSPRAIVYMNDIALNALEPYFRQFTEGLLFDFTPDRYKAVETEAVKDAIVQACSVRPLDRLQIWEAVIPQFFMHYRKKDYRLMIEELFRSGRLHADPRTMNTPGKLNEKTRLSPKPFPRT